MTLQDLANKSKAWTLFDTWVQNEHPNDVVKTRLWYDIQQFKKIDPSEVFALGNAASGIWDKYFDRDSPLSEDIRGDFFDDDLDRLRNNLSKPNKNTFSSIEENIEDILNEDFESWMESEDPNLASIPNDPPKSKASVRFSFALTDQPPTPAATATTPAPTTPKPAPTPASQVKTTAPSTPMKSQPQPIPQRTDERKGSPSSYDSKPSTPVSEKFKKGTIVTQIPNRTWKAEGSRRIALPKVQKVSESTEPKTWDDVEYEEEEWYMTISKPAQQEEEMKEDVDKLATAPDSDDEDDEVYEDPLGIVNAMNKKDDKGSILLTQDNFNPELFLSVVHKDTSYSQLRDGYKNLEKKLKNRTERLKILVRDNFSHFVSCKDTIDTIHEALIQNEEGRSGNSLQLYVSYSDLLDSTKLIFQKLLDRKQEADKVRKQLKIVDSYQYIFGMPVRIRRNIQQEKYEKVLSDYKKINLVLTNSPIPIFQRAKTEVDTIVEDFRNNLFKQLDDPTKSLQDQTKRITYVARSKVTDQRHIWS